MAAALVVLAGPIVLGSPAAAEPRPWHDPAYVVRSSTDGQGCGQASGDGTWSTRSRCPVSTTAVPAPKSKAQVEYEERLAAEAAKSKAQVEYEERLAAEAAKSKAQVEYEERLAAEAD